MSIAIESIPTTTFAAEPAPVAEPAARIEKIEMISSNDIFYEDLFCKPDAPQFLARIVFVCRDAPLDKHAMDFRTDALHIYFRPVSKLYFAQYCPNTCTMGGAAGDIEKETYQLVPDCQLGELLEFFVGETVLIEPNLVTMSTVKKGPRLPALAMDALEISVEEIKACDAEFELELHAWDTEPIHPHKEGQRRLQRVFRTPAEIKTAYEVEWAMEQQKLRGKAVAEEAAATVVEAAAMAAPHIPAVPCPRVETYCRPRYVYHGYIVLTHMDLSMFNGHLFLNTDMRQDCISIYYDKETGGAYLLYNAQSDEPCGVTHGTYTLPAEATFRDIVRNFCGTNCEIGYTSAWNGRGIPDKRADILAFPMSALGEKEDRRREIHCHVTNTTPLRPTTGQIVNGVCVN